MWPLKPHFVKNNFCRNIFMSFSHLFVIEVIMTRNVWYTFLFRFYATNVSLALHSLCKLGLSWYINVIGLFECGIQLVLFIAVEYSFCEIYTSTLRDSELSCLKQYLHLNLTNSFTQSNLGQLFHLVSSDHPWAFSNPFLFPFLLSFTIFPVALSTFLELPNMIHSYKYTLKLSIDGFDSLKTSCTPFT